MYVNDFLDHHKDGTICRDLYQHLLCIDDTIRYDRRYHNWWTVLRNQGGPRVQIRSRFESRVLMSDPLWEAVGRKGEGGRTTSWLVPGTNHSKGGPEPLGRSTISWNKRRVRTRRLAQTLNLVVWPSNDSYLCIVYAMWANDHVLDVIAKYMYVLSIASEYFIRGFGVGRLICTLG